MTILTINQMKHQYFLNTDINILIVDDQIEDLIVLTKILKEYQYKISLATDITLASKYVQASAPHLILLNINISNLDDQKLDLFLVESQQCQDTPMIFIGDDFNVIKTFSFTGIDFIFKPFDINEAINCIESQLQHKFPHFCKNKLNLNLGDKIQKSSFNLSSEITTPTTIKAKSLKMSLYDAMTNLPNRNWLAQKLQEQLNIAQNNSNYEYAILCFDCNNFKVVNYSLGREIGDALLKKIASRIQSCLPEKSFLARLTGDEFIILLSDISGLESVTTITKNIQQILSTSFQIQQQEIFLNFSAGIVLGNEDYKQPEQILRSADLAMHQAKIPGKRQYLVYEKAMYQRALERLQLEADLRKAIKNQEFTLYYQPIICLKTGAIVGFESLVRWQHPKLGMISPNKFIPIAEETGLIMPLGIWILQEACHQLKIWHKKYNPSLSLTMNINVAVQQFADENLIETIDKIIKETQLPSNCLKLEITESAIMENSDVANGILEQFKERNIPICIDDFGTGYSSLSYLHQFPVDNLKIDRSFVSRIQDTSKPQKVVNAIADLAHNLDMTVTAEGIETKAQLQYITNLGCEYGQGYYFSPPLSAQQIEDKKLISAQKFNYIEEQKNLSNLSKIAELEINQ